MADNKSKPLRLPDLVAFASSTYSGYLADFRNNAAWDTLSITKEGRHVELKRIKDLYQRLKAVHDRSAYADPDMPHRLAVAFTAEVFRETNAPPANDALVSRVGESAAEMLAEEIFFGFPAIDFDVPLALDDTMALRAYLEEKRHFLLYADAILPRWSERFTAMWSALFTHLPNQMFLPEADASAGALTLTRPLSAAMERPAEAITRLIGAVFDEETRQHNLFRALAGRIEINVMEASGIAPEDRLTTSRSAVLPNDSKEPAEHLPAIYLAGTPFRPLFSEEIALTVPQELRFEHCHIVAGTGHGKTQLMQSMMLADFDNPDRPAVVAIDSQGDMMRTLSRLERFNPAHDDRLIILDPADTEWPLRLNLFDVNRDRVDALPRGEREQLLAGIIELYDYIFGALLGAELTQKQSVVFRFLAQLMLTIPDATIHTLRQLLEDPTPFWPYVEQMPATARTFLTEHLFASAKRGQRPNDYNATRSQVLRRLYGILSNPTFERLFSHPKNALDMKRALDEGKVILVNTAKDVLKTEASAIFGRYVIALILKAALERAADARADRRPAFVYIDEAADYFDDNIDTLLIQARKYNVGLTFAHQFMDQLAPGLRASVLSNPAIRFAGGISSKDAAALREDMRTSSEFLLGARKQTGATEFACFARNLTPTAMKYVLPLGQAEREERMDAASTAELLARVRATVAAPISETTTRTSEKPPEVAPNSAESDSYGDQY